MKFLRSTVLLAVAVAASTLAVAKGEVAAGFALVHEADSPVDDSTLLTKSYLRHLVQEEGSNTGPTPTTSTPTPTTTEPSPSPSPTTTQPATTSPAPTTQTPAPTTATPEPTTATPTPTTQTPAPTTATPTPTTTEASNNTTAPSTTAPAVTTAGPATSAPSSEGSKDDTNVESTVKPEGSVDGSGVEKKSVDTPSPGVDTTTKSSKMSTGAIIGIVCGIVAGVAILAVIAVVLARRRREEDDDPLSPFELSMDKGYGGPPGFNNGNANNNQYATSNATNQYGNGNGYSGARTATNNSAAIGAAGGAVLGGAAGVAMLSTDTPAAGADAAGVAYTQFYDPVTSPGSTYYQQQSQRNLSGHTDDAATNNDSNLWMSAMEPKDNDVEGMSASVPPELSLPGDDTNSFISRNSYDIPGSESIDIDQSSVLSGGSDLEKDFPDYEDESSRGSYEL